MTPPFSAQKKGYIFQVMLEGKIISWEAERRTSTSFY
jgi:hypothetical protein